MNMYDILDTKRKGGKLTGAQLEHFISGVTKGSIPDYQTSALLMAICTMGADEEETLALTQAMAVSGRNVNLSFLPGVTCDKHSSGGVGDTTTLVVAPACAALGLTVAKMSGRGLGHTGGTIDKLESIPGLKTELTPIEFSGIIRKCGIAIASQTEDVAPADKKLYALRDATATVASIPLIAASIMSKKLAMGAHVLALDVKYGSGAFMKTADDAKRLAELMVAIAEGAGRKAVALVTSMESPLGAAVGNALEVWDAVQLMCGRRRGSRLETLCAELCAQLLVLSNSIPDLDTARARAMVTIRGGSALRKFQEMVKLQGGDVSYVTKDGSNKLLSAHIKREVCAQGGGFVQALDALEVGNAARLLGAGRFTREDVLDPAVGVNCLVGVGDSVASGDVLFEVHANDEKSLDDVCARLSECCVIGDEATEIPPLIEAVISR